MPKFWNSPATPVTFLTIAAAMSPYHTHATDEQNSIVNIMDSSTSSMLSNSSANSPPFISPLANKTVVIGKRVTVRVVPNDADGTVPALHMLNAPINSQFTDNRDGTRTFIWTPTENDTGFIDVTFRAVDATDSSLTHSRTLKLKVVTPDGNSGNQPPTLPNMSDQTITIGSQFDFRVKPEDPEGKVPGLRVDPLPPGASFRDNGDGSRQFFWKPTVIAPGTVNLSFIAVDADEPQLRTTKTMTLTVRDTDGTLIPGTLGSSQKVVNDSSNRAPMFTPMDDYTVALGQSFDFTVTPLDVDGTVPGLAIQQLPFGATFEDNFDGSRQFKWSPLPMHVGNTKVTFEAIDAEDSALRTLRTITLNVYRDPNNPVNFKPYINGIYYPMIRAGDTLTQIVTPVDPDFTVPNLNVLNPPAGSKFVDNYDGSRTLVWATDENDLGNTQVTFVASDSEDPGLQARSTITISVVEPNSLKRKGQRLRSLAEQRNFRIGFAATLNSAKLADNELYLEMAAEEFNIVTPENSQKMKIIQPRRGVFRFADSDRLLNFATRNNMQFHGHPLVWYAQLPDWVLNLDPSEAEEVMLEHIAALAGRYQSRVAVWDVVNEALEDDGSLRKSIWYQGMGGDYIRKAFEAARAADPFAKLIYNDYDVLWENNKSDAMYELLKRALAAGTPIDGVGFQAHLKSDFNNFDSVERNLQRFADLGLEIYITEFDVEIQAGDNDKTQAMVYQRTLEACLANSNCNTMQAWGFTDRYSWKGPSKPLLFTDRYQPKPAYLAWQKTLAEFAR